MAMTDPVMPPTASGSREEGSHRPVSRSSRHLPRPGYARRVRAETPKDPQSRQTDGTVPGPAGCVPDVVGDLRRVDPAAGVLAMVRGAGCGGDVGTLASSAPAVWANCSDVGSVGR